MVGPLASPATVRRWVYLILGGVVLFPYLLADAVMVTVLRVDGLSVWSGLLTVVFVVVLPALTAFIPVVRMLAGTAAKALLGGPIAGHPIDEARTWSNRWRTAAWFLVHLVAGFTVAILTMIVLTDLVISFMIPFVGAGGASPELGITSPGLGLWQWPTQPGWRSAWTPLAGTAVLVALVYLVAGLGTLLSRLAPVLLGPSSAERLAELERRAGELAERNRLARELHDSVGHALSVVTLQAGAANRVLPDDPDFVRRALDAIGESARTALEDLDHVLGLLREDEAARPAPQPTLRDLDRLLGTARSAGAEVDLEVVGAVEQIPRALSREAYRIVQEGLTNAVRHAGRVPVTLRITARDDRLELEMTNPLGTAGRTAEAGSSRGGRGLRGVEERVAVLRGQMSAGPDRGCWRVAVQLPLRPAP
ncbi:MAG: sensor histidine kinase [Streptosporangiales bacterium]|nr:sensor histidine kinase [Streptosporangiales bacterium]